MAITILDYVKNEVGEKETYSMADHDQCGVPMMGGCQGCGASIATYNAYPSITGYLRCADCIGEQGFANVTAFATWIEAN